MNSFGKKFENAGIPEGYPKVNWQKFLIPIIPLLASMSGDEGKKH